MIRPDDCAAENASATFIDVFVHYDVLGTPEPRSSAQAAKLYCERSAERRPALRISGVDFYRCLPVRQPRRAVAYIGQRPDPEDKGGADWLIFEITLRCPDGDCPAHAKVLQRVIQGLDLRLTPYDESRFPKFDDGKLP